MSFKSLMSSVTVLSLLTACQPGSMQAFENLFTKENVGTATGAVGGAWIGSNVGKGKGNVAAIAVGTLLGAQLGRSIGASLDRADMNYYNHASQNTLEYKKDGQTSSWMNPNNGHSGTITPVKTYRTPRGTHCREYSQTISISGRYEEAYGTACRQPDGTWKIQN